MRSSLVQLLPRDATRKTRRRRTTSDEGTHHRYQWLVVLRFRKFVKLHFQILQLILNILVVVEILVVVVAAMTTTPATNNNPLDRQVTHDDPKNVEDDVVIQAAMMMETILLPTPAVMDMVMAAVGQEITDRDEHDRYGYHHCPNTRKLTKSSFYHVPKPPASAIGKC